MLKLIKLELKRTNIKPYVIGAISITVFITAILHIIGFASKDSTEIDVGDSPLATSGAFVSFFSVLMMACFAILAAVMVGRLVVNEYGGKNAVLLFSYPVKRSKVLLAKLVLVSVFTSLSMILGGLITLPVFMGSHVLFHFIPFDFDLSLLGFMLLAVLGSSVVTIAVSMAGLWIGLWKNSLPATIVSVLIIASLFTNLLVGSIQSNPILLAILAAISAVLILVFYIILTRGLEQREV